MISIALQFLPEKDMAPVIIASGEGYFGDLIHEIAKKNEIPVQKNPELATVLLGHPVGAEIPENLYLAVAKIFAFIHNIEKDLI